MTEREKVMIQREAAAKALNSSIESGGETISDLVNRLFPLPKEPNVVRVGSIDIRQNEQGGGFLEYREASADFIGEWRPYWSDRSIEAAIRAVIAQPFKPEGE